MPRKTWLQVRCSPWEKQRWTELADARGVNLSEYVRSLLNAVVRRDEEKRDEQQRLDG